MSERATREFDSVAALERARERVADLRSELDRAGEDDAEEAVEAYRRAHRLLDRYVDDATGTGDFKSYVQFRGEFATLVEELSDDLPRREAFEEALEHVDKRRLGEDDFEAARAALSAVDDLVELIEDRDDARERYRQARIDAADRLDAIEERIADAERLLELGEADLDAPVEELREPIERYNEGVREAFATYRRETPARELLAFVERTAYYPLVELPPPPADLLEYVRDSPDGTEPIPTLLEYADYSRSKLTHYADDPDALKRNVATQRTYLEGLDAEPLTIDWPPEEAGALRLRAGELMSVAGRFAPEPVLAALRRVRDLTVDRERYERLRAAAEATHELDADDRERLADGAVERELEELRAERAALEERLDEHPEP